MAPPFVSEAASCVPYDAGWIALPSGGVISAMPFWDETEGLFARLGPGTSAQLLANRNLALPTVAQLDELHALATHIEPYTLPTPTMIKIAGIAVPYDATGKDTPKMAAYRAGNMRTKAWCAQHDAAVFAKLDAARWSGRSAVDNAGKHWAAGGLIYGWWLAAGGVIQPPSAFHAATPAYTDYATTFHAVSYHGAPFAMRTGKRKASPARFAAGGTMCAVGAGAAYLIDRYWKD